MGNCISKRKNGGGGGEAGRFGKKKNEKNVGGSTKSVSTVNSSDAEGRVQQQNGVGRKDTSLAGPGRTTAQHEADVVAAPPASSAKAKEETSRETATARTALTLVGSGEAPAAQEPAVSPPTQVGIKSAPERHVRAISRPADLNIGNITSKPKVAAILPPAPASPPSASPVSPVSKSKNALERVSTSDSIDSPTGKGAALPPAPTPPPSAPTPPPMPPTPPPRGGMATIAEE
jgi:hypothetical protein